MILERTKRSEGLESLPPEELKKLSQETREFLIERISHTGGHLASNLGVVELTVVLHLTFNLSKDKVIWDVGHQSYTHKILIGRMAEFDELRQYGGLGGFPKHKESPYDSLDTGHSSASISAGLRIALGRDLKELDYRVISVIGDGALTDGITYEALNNVVRMKRNFVIVLNNNSMSISESVGGMSRYLSGLRMGSSCSNLKRNVADALDRVPVVGSVMTDKIKRIENNTKQLFIPGMPFEGMGITYLGSMGGHSIPALRKVLRETQKLNHTALVHVIAKKEKGYRPAEKNPSHLRGVDPFDVDTGKPLLKQKNPSYTNMFSRKICQPGEQYPNLVAMTAATPDDTGLIVFGKKYPHRFFNMDIAEAHVVASMTGMVMVGLKPVVTIYSSPLQRAYDRILHNVCIQDPPVPFVVGRVGLVGSDGEIRQGVFDCSFFTSIPSMSAMAPKNIWELKAMLEFAMRYDRPLAVRYPRGEAYRGLRDFRQPVAYGEGEILYEKEGTALLAVGSMASTGEYVGGKLKKEGYACSLANDHSVKLIGIELADRPVRNHGLIVTLEENIPRGGYRLAVTAYIHQNYPHIKVLSVALSDDYVKYDNAFILREGLGIDSDFIIRTMRAGGQMNGLNQRGKDERVFGCACGAEKPD